MILTFNFWAQCAVAVAVTGLGASYLGWRIYQLTIVKSTFVIPYIFVSLEMALYFSSVLWFIDMLWTYDKRRNPKILPVQSHFEWPTVDVLIPCCKEPTDLVKDTALTALWQDYPVDKFMVYLLDDGKDDNLREWVETEQAVNGTNIRYIRRHKLPDVPHHAKAGNINHGLGVTTGEFVAILDADMLIKPEFLRSMLAQFSSENIAYVQCPQYYYNVPDGDPLGQVCSFFYDVVMPHRDTRSSAPSVGTGVIFRRSALERIGGISTGTLTEDFDTSMKLQNLGYKTVYINEKLQFGLVPTDLPSALRQRERWAIGTLQIFFKRSPLLTPGEMTWTQRIMYFSCGIAYILPIFIVLFITLPVLTLLFDWPILPIAGGQTKTLILLLVPYLFANRLIIYTMYWNVESPVMARNRDFQSFLWMSPYLVIALLRFIISGIMPTKFKVTNASKKRGACFRKFESISMCWFHIAYIAVGTAALVYRGYKWDTSDCINSFQYLSQVIYVLMNMQSMAAPILYVVFSEKEIDRKSRLSYNKYGVPVIDFEKVRPKPTFWPALLEVIPALWGLSYVVIFAGFLVNYDFQCRLYYQLSDGEWLKATKF